jgi:xanthine/CO dehydrogenase XdhC/CoxF family maturation factor
MIQNLKEEIAPDIDLSLLHTPIGLKIGGDTAHEIALSIASEIQAVKYGKNVTIEG